jgi:hypothetical protein
MEPGKVVCTNHGSVRTESATQAQPVGHRLMRRLDPARIGANPGVLVLLIHDRHGLHCDTAARLVDGSHVMIVFLAASFWVWRILVAFHVNCIWFVFSPHTLLI